MLGVHILGDEIERASFDMADLMLDYLNLRKLVECLEKSHIVWAVRLVQEHDESATVLDPVEREGQLSRCQTNRLVDSLQGPCVSIKNFAIAEHDIELLSLEGSVIRKFDDSGLVLRNEVWKAHLSRQHGDIEKLDFDS